MTPTAAEINNLFIHSKESDGFHPDEFKMIEKSPIKFS